MKAFKNIDEILDFAINEEQKAIDFYSELAGKANSDDMRKIFVDFAKEEMSHKAKLEKIKNEKQFNIIGKEISDLKIADYLVNVEVSANMTYSDALVVAMKKEKAAFKLYMTLMERSPSQELKSIFLSLAQEESKHKLKFELEYDEYVLREN